MRKTVEEVDERLYEQFKAMLSQKYYGKRIDTFTEEDKTELKKDLLAIFMREVPEVVLEVKLETRERVYEFEVEASEESGDDVSRLIFSAFTPKVDKEPNNNV